MARTRKTFGRTLVPLFYAIFWEMDGRIYATIVVMRKVREQLQLPYLQSPAKPNNGKINRLEAQDRAFHDWYRFVLSYPPHLVGKYLDDFELGKRDRVLDPFCGTGTTLVEAKKRRIPSFGMEANPFAHFASSVKVNWEIDAELYWAWAQEIADRAQQRLRSEGILDEPHVNGKVKLRTLDAETAALLIRNSISPLPLHKALTLCDELLTGQQESFYPHALLALANALVFSISNLRFGPEVGVGRIKEDAPVVRLWLNQVEKMVEDLRLVGKAKFPDARVFLADARTIPTQLKPNSVTAVITSPPYPNEKDYTRTTRLESVLLGFIKSRAELRSFKQQLVRSNTRAVFKHDDDDRWIRGNTNIEALAREIEARRLALGKTSGFEKLYARVTRLYFGGMARHLAELRPFLHEGAYLAYVVGDQASYFQVLIRTGTLLAEVAESLGYEVVRIELFRERFSTASRQYLREEAVILRWNGNADG